MKALVVLLDAASPSFCYYATPAAAPRPMSKETFEQVVAYAQRHALGLQLIAGPAGVPAALRSLLDAAEIPYLAYAPLGGGELAAEEVPAEEVPAEDVPVEDVPVEDVPVVELASTAARPSLQGLEPGRHPIAILRVAPSMLSQWPATWRELSARVHRVVLVLAELERWQEADLETYKSTLAEVSDALQRRYLDGELIELNVLSDRLRLDAPAECGAGLEHLTVDADGRFHLCPGFAAAADATPLGALPGEPLVKNAQLLERDRAPICKPCDAYHCRRCIYLNQRTTLELNTPPWQSCRTAHLEREASRLLLSRLHEKGRLRGLAPLSALSYEDPFELCAQGYRMPRRREKTIDDRRPASTMTPTTTPMTTPTTPRLDRPGHEEKTMAEESSGAASEKRIVGRVTPEERDEIRALFLRKSALNELFLSLAKLDAETLEQSPLYDKVVRDMGEVTVKFQSWWDKKGAAYGWQGREGGSWNLDFETCEVSLG